MDDESQNLAIRDYYRCFHTIADYRVPLVISRPSENSDINSEEIIVESSNRTYFLFYSSIVLFFVFSLIKLAVFVEKSENVRGGTLDRGIFIHGDF